MKNKEYSNGEITILWQPDKCAHSGICVKSLPLVYKPKESPWICPEQGSTDELIIQISNCPSGALSYRRNENNPKD